MADLFDQVNKERCTMMHQANN